MTRAEPLLLTAGEPAGIGPDLCVALAARPDLPGFVAVGDPAVFRDRARMLGSSVDIVELTADAPVETPSTAGTLQVVPFLFPRPVVCGQPDPENAAALLDGLRYAVERCVAGQFGGLVTGPVQKSVINEAGIPFTGHTEFLAGLTGAPCPVMLLAAGELRVALVTTHLPLAEVPSAITPERLRAVLDVLLTDLERRFGIERPEVLVCGLNPHAGEGGHLGSEDRDVIAPVVAEFVARGERVRGPLPADTAFTPAAGPRDAVLAMYHDQGLPVLKYAGFGHAVNITLGLPIVRTSVDHGTALDKAGRGGADAGSIAAALECAARLASVP